MTVVQLRVSNTLHRVTKSEKVITKEADCLQRPGGVYAGSQLLNAICLVSSENLILTSLDNKLIKLKSTLL